MLVFGSRGSDLALTQTRAVAEALRRATGCEYRIEVIETRGDRIIDRPLPQIGGKGVFTAELEQALRRKHIDAAVHSMKDLPVQDPDGLTIGAVPGRVDPADVLIIDPRWHDPSAGLLPLRRGCRVGTSSHRRRAALERLRTDLQFADLRGNVPTRVDKVRRGDYGAIVLAAAGLDRLALKLDGLLRVRLPVEHCTPAPAQGALAVQCRSDDTATLALLAKLHDASAAQCATAERDVLYRLGGGCSMPLGALVTADGKGFRLQAALYNNPTVSPAAAGVFVDLYGNDLDSMAAHIAARWRALIDAPLAGRDLVLLRPEGADDTLDNELTVAGARVQRRQLTRIVPIQDHGLRSDMLHDRTLAFTSARAINLFGTAWRGASLGGQKAFVCGPATADAARAIGLEPVMPTRGTCGSALAAHVLECELPRRGVLFPCAHDRHPAFETTLRAAGRDVLAVPLYRSEPSAAELGAVPPGAIIVFTSPSAVQAYARLAVVPTDVRHVAIGATTAAAMATAGVRCDGTADEPTAAGLVRCCLEVSRV